MKIRTLAIYIALLLVSFPAMAYIDPASGSAIMSAIIGFLVAIGLAIKTYWYKLKSIFTGKKSGQEVISEQDSEEKR